MTNSLGSIWSWLCSLLARTRARLVGARRRAKVRYDAWVEREQAKNEALKKDGDEKWDEVKQLWREHNQDR